MALAFVALGSNLGDRQGYLDRARAALDALPGSRVLAASRVEETDAIGPAGQGPYLNQMIALETTLAPHALLDALQAIESENGRVRTARWGARTLDLDIVAIDGVHVNDDRLRVPHPELPHRAFWQRELAELRASTGDASAHEAGR